MLRIDPLNNKDQHGTSKDTTESLAQLKGELRCSERNRRIAELKLEFYKGRCCAYFDTDALEKLAMIYVSENL